MRRICKNARARKQCHILKMLEAQAKKPHISLHTPGHKQKGWDITELDYSDNLSAPRGVLKNAQEDIARVLNAEQSFLLTDGSTSGVLSMLHAAKALGATCVLASENSHKSVYNGCALLGLELLLLPAEEKDGIPLPLTAEYLFQNQTLLQKADALIITSPDYYGNVADLASLRAYCDQENKLLVVDGAHGGHLHFDKKLYAGAYADLWVDGVHKSLPALTQGAVVSARTEQQSEALAKAVDIFRTTSPSYPIMASVEYAVHYPQNCQMETLVKEWVRQNARMYKNDDWTKVCLLFGESAFKAQAYLQSKGVYAEFCDGNVVCLYFSPAVTKRTFMRVKRLVEKAFETYSYQAKKKNDRIPAPLVLHENQVEWVELNESEGRVLAANVGLFPPCVPLKKQGETMDRESVQTMQKASNVFGVQNGKVAVYKGI